MLVNDRSVSVLENYDFEVIRTQKAEMQFCVRRIKVGIS